MAPMSMNHKEALAKGRRQAKIVRRYLDALEAHKSKGSRGRPSDPEAVRAKISDYEQRIEHEDDALRRVELIQRRLDSEEHLRDLTSLPDIQEHESDFVEVVGEYSERKGITYKAWRELGLPASLLREAGLPLNRGESG